MDNEQLLGIVAANLRGKGYTPISLPALSLAMFKPASGLGVPKLVGVSASTSGPQVKWSQTEAHLREAVGRSGAGLLLLAYSSPSRDLIAQALSLGQGALGYGQIVAGVYDLDANSYYLPRGAYDTVHMGWDQEVFG